MLTKLAELKQVVALQGRKIMVVGPFCWGTGPTGAQAYKNASDNFSPSYVRAPYLFRFFDVPTNAVVDDISGGILADKKATVTHLGTYSRRAGAR